MTAQSVRHQSQPITTQPTPRALADVEREVNAFAAVVGLVAIAVLVVLVLFV